ncbi:hypothetical protein [Dietzia sp. 179-F 9C3 NHS]|uniref:hypothetical protein n=1 Tax=Dietzia sp. 179-F 9C3 NHS TaxID=3374295 RepID=UPI003879263B
MAHRPDRAGMWKLTAVETYAGDRPLFWLDDEHDDTSRAWAAQRSLSGPDTRVQWCDPDVGITAGDLDVVAAWARTSGGEVGI